ncbi:MAG: flavin reductase, partial [Clostridia bacterium]|nr:flavin reductase [Clostridia bacterium]
MNNKALFNLTYGLFVLTAQEDGFDNGCIINTAMQVTGTPNRISVTVNKNNYTTKMIEKTKKFNVSVISEKADFALFQRFGFRSGADGSKFEDFDGAFARAQNGVLCITKGTNAFISCTVEQIVDVGTHLLFVAAVDDCEILSDAASMTYAYYFANVKPKPQTEGKKG